EGLPAFLRDMKIYQTSAVKCLLGRGTASPGERVIANCRRKFLDEQISRLPAVELLLPMGRLAVASVLHRPFDSVNLEEVIGRQGKGILRPDRNYGMTVVALPHPSGLNRSFNPPVFIPGDHPRDVRRKQAFVRALKAVRAKLEAMGYGLNDLAEEELLGPLDRF